EGEHRPIAPAAEEQVAVDVHAGVGEAARDAGHATGLVVDLGDDRLALDVRVAAFVEDLLRRLVVGRGHDHVAAVAEPAAADGAQVDAARGELLREVRHRARVVLQLDHELVGHRLLLGRRTGCADRSARTLATVLVMTLSATAADLPPAIAAALASPQLGARDEVDAAGTRWPTLVWGDSGAPPVLLVHGVTSNAGIWWRVGPAIAAAGRHVVAVDMPGHGRTPRAARSHRFIDTATELAAFIRAAGLNVPELAVVGHSWGGMVTAHLPAAGLAPHTLVLLDPPSLTLERLRALTESPTERDYPTLEESIAAVRAANPTWSDGDVEAKAVALTELTRSSSSTCC